MDRSTGITWLCCLVALQIIIIAIPYYAQNISWLHIKLVLLGCTSKYYSEYSFAIYSISYQEIFDIDDEAFPWFLNNAAKKWKEFKSTLKKQFFDEKLTLEQLKKIHGERLNDDDWKELIKYWASEESQVSTNYS